MVIDIMLVITMLYGFYLGFSKGIISTVFTILSLFFGVMAALKFGPATTDFLEKAFNSQNPLMFLAGILLTFVVVMVIIRIFARSLEGILKTANINVLNQIAGGVLSSGILIVLFSVLVWFGDQARIVDANTKQTSLTYKYIEGIPAQAKDLAYRFQPMFQEFWNSSMDMMDRLEGMSLEQSETEPNIYDIPEDDEKKILLIDNYDSFTYNLYDYFLQLNTDCEVFRNDEKSLAEFRLMEFDILVLSPGPKQPKDAGLMMDLIEYFHNKKPILGICLGHQGLGTFFGATLKKAILPVHGKTSRIQHEGHSIFKNLPAQFHVMRYHSLIIDDFKDTPLLPIANTSDGEVMAMAHETLPIIGIQFHPESILTEHGLALLENCLDWLN